ncbi:MAG: hypothetical protein ACHQ0J_01785 [Candidatus Dormibacterales bacterium]
MGRLAGSTSTVVRDITDIAHPTNTATVQLVSTSLDPWGPWKPALIGGTEVADGTGASLSVLTLPSAQRTTVYQGCRDTLVTFGWSPSGDYLTYVREINFPAGSPWQFEWHLVGHGADRLLATTAAWCHCDGEGPADNYSLAAGFSPDGNYVLLVESGLGPFPANTMGIQIRTLTGDLVAAESGGAMPVWSGADLYYRDSSGVLKWRGGTTAQVLSGIQWIRPNSSPAGGMIVYWARSADGLGRVYLLDLTTGTTRQLSAEPRMEPIFLSPRYIWYEGERACTDADKCGFVHTMPTGITYIYDLSDGTESQSAIAAVYDAWPHGT